MLPLTKVKDRGPWTPGPDLWGVQVGAVIPSLGPHFTSSLGLGFFICKIGANRTYLSSTAERVE